MLTASVFNKTDNLVQTFVFGSLFSCNPFLFTSNNVNDKVLKWKLSTRKTNKQDIWLNFLFQYNPWNLIEMDLSTLNIEGSIVSSRDIKVLVSQEYKECSDCMKVQDITWFFSKFISLYWIYFSLIVKKTLSL